MREKIELKNSFTNYRLNTKCYFIEKEQLPKKGTQGSYNIPRSFFNELLKKNIITNDFAVTNGSTSDEFNTYYVLSEDYKLILGDNIQRLIGDFSNEDLGIIFLSGDSKPQVRKQLMDKLKIGKNTSWFSKLYDSASQPGEIEFICDEELRVFIIEYTHYTKELLTNLKKEHKIYEYNKKDNLSFDDFSRQLIYFGAPGTGKSYMLNNNAKKLIGEYSDDHYERVTFHPEYNYANFVGTYKPVSNQEGEIVYKYVPGPFMRILAKALKNLKEDKIEPFLLIIEEINRANVASVFGEVFQLLDRKSDTKESEYSIEASEDIKKHLSKVLGGIPEEYSKIKIPSNLFIWATMNSADQGVFPMDTAFKRRWDFHYISIDFNEERIENYYVELNNEKINLNKLRKSINNALSSYGLNEDKLLGPYFINLENLKIASSPLIKDENFGDKVAENCIKIHHNRQVFVDTEEFVKIFKNKVIMYLFEDIAKHKVSNLFSGCLLLDETMNLNRYSLICEMFDKVGIKIFDPIIFNNELLEELK
ncbi:AAA family ATPase [Globicatella sulfidifaciens]|uniref:McrB family protein n=1 Tax=Globicatella sulfidifaciens TaxID=136093 RepID=UPI00288E0414|nr:AAA family ATPase [Globicatella sulfidifaciens]MDT2768036.1 AAA family ATPase [Globicatella sulfidifaciens]